jgi:hypothetical protein
MVYVFATSTYIVFLSSRIPVHHHYHHVAASQIQHLSGNGASGKFFDKQHGAFKSTFPNKRKVISIIYSLVCLAVLAFTPGFRKFCINIATSAGGRLMYAGEPCYLSLRVLRI